MNMDKAPSSLSCPVWRFTWITSRGKFNRYSLELLIFFGNSYVHWDLGVIPDWQQTPKTPRLSTLSGLLPQHTISWEWNIFPEQLKAWDLSHPTWRRNPTASLTGKPGNTAFPKHPSNISITGICCRRRQEQPLIPPNQTVHTERGKGKRKKSLSDAFALWIMNSSRRSTHYNWNRLIINYAQSMSKRTSSECLMCGNSDWTLSWHFVISTCQQGAQAERQKHSGRKSELEEEGGL